LIIDYFLLIVFNVFLNHHQTNPLAFLRKQEGGQNPIADNLLSNASDFTGNATGLQAKATVQTYATNGH